MICCLKEFNDSLKRTNIYQLFRYSDEEYKAFRCYNKVFIEKRDGGERILHVPNKNLKELQRQLLHIFQWGEVSDYAAAYVKKKRLVDHANEHTGSPMLVKLDIEDFFGSISFSQVFRGIDDALRRAPSIGAYQKSLPIGENNSAYNSQLSWYFTKFCTLNGTLPQGAPTSPILSNLIFLPLDHTIYAYCHKRNIRYTRYSDDMIFSGSFQPTGLIRFIRKLLADNGFCLNEDKTVIAGNGRQKKVTGIIVNQRPQVERNYRRGIRQELYYIGKFGLAEHLQRKEGLKTRHTYSSSSGQMDYEEMALQVKTLQSLMGKINYVLQVDGQNEEFLKYKRECIGLLNLLPHLWNG